MSPFETRADRARRRRRYTVRVVRRVRIPRAAKLSLLFALVVGVGFALVWRQWGSDEHIVPYRRSLLESVLDWKCGRGHTFRAAGRIEPRPCSKCGRPSFPVAIYECEVHGSFQVFVRLKEDDLGRARPEAYRIGKGTWIAAEDPLHCPNCVRVLVRKKADPLATRSRR